MALMRLLLGVVAVVCLAVAPACAYSLTARSAGAEAAAQASMDGMHDCFGEPDDATHIGAAPCPVLCGFLLMPACGFAELQFARLDFSLDSPSLEESGLKPPAPPPRFPRR
jgi:hypothetical protein